MAYGEDSGQRLSTSLFLPIWSERWRLLGVVRMHLASGRGGRSRPDSLWLFVGCPDDVVCC